MDDVCEGTNYERNFVGPSKEEISLGIFDIACILSRRLDVNSFTLETQSFRSFQGYPVFVGVSGQ